MSEMGRNATAASAKRMMSPDHLALVTFCTAANAIAWSSAPVATDGIVPELTGSVITAPMVGTFYHSTSPSEPPLIQVGDRIEAGQVIGIIEAMKIMNEIASDRNGLVVEIIAPSGTAVEYGSPLVRVAP